MRKDMGLEFPTLMDPELAVTRAFGLLNDKGNLPHPAAVIIDDAGTVRFLRVDEDYRVRPEPAELLTALEGITEPN